MAKDTRIAFRASAELKTRLQNASKKLKLGETALAEAAVEAAVQYIEENGGIWFPLRVVPDPDSAPPTGKGGKTPGHTGKPRQKSVHTAGGENRFTASLPTHAVNEDAPTEIEPLVPARGRQTSGPRARSARGAIQKLVNREGKK
jgi:hypothetical protein